MKVVAKVARGEGHVALIDIPEPGVTPAHVLIEVKAASVRGTDHPHLPLGWFPQPQVHRERHRHLASIWRLW